MFPQAQLGPVPVVAEVPGLGVPAMGEDQLDQGWVITVRGAISRVQRRSRSSDR